MYWNDKIKNVDEFCKVEPTTYNVLKLSGYDVVPSGIIAYIRMAVSTMYENRESYVIGVSIDKNANPLLDKMLNMFRIQPIWERED